MSANATTAAPTGRKKAIGHPSSAIGNPAQPPAALGHDSQNTSCPQGAKESVAIPLPDQIRTVLAVFRDRVFTGMFPGRTDPPKTLIFAKDDAHADDIVRLCRGVFGKGNDFCKQITYKTTGEAPKALIAAFRNSYHPRIAVTVDMIATGTDIKPLEIVFFMRSVASKNFLEQMKGRGVRVVSDTEMEQVNPGVKRKTRYLIVDAVGEAQCRTHVLVCQQSGEKRQRICWN